MRDLLKAACVCTALILAHGCGSGGSGVGFDLRRDAPPFANVGGDAIVQLTGDSAARMFGADVVCEGGNLPCVTLPVAQTWIDAVNETLAEGRSEGIAVLTQLFHRGDLDPRDFGAETVGELTLEGNTPLQAELAYWTATQHVPDAVSNQRLTAAEAVPFFQEALQRGAEERYRLALAVRTGTGFDSGHAVVPVSIRAGDGRGRYLLRIYDSNFPQRLRDIEIDTVANRWIYVVRVNDDITLRYEGTATNGNYLYVAPVSERLGVLRAPFASDAASGWLVHSGQMNVSVDAGAGVVGVEGGTVTEAGGTISPLFTRCPLCGGSRGFLNYKLTGGSSTDGPVNVSFTGVAGSSGTGDASFGLTGRNHATRVTGVGASSESSGFSGSFSVEPNGDLELTNSSGTPLRVSSASTVDGITSSINVTIEGASTSVRIVRNADGTVGIDLSGVPAGVSVTIGFLSNGPNAARTNPYMSEFTYTFVSDGMDSTATFDPEDGGLRVGSELYGGPCFNQQLDAGEGGVDCGGVCTRRCRPGAACMVDADCETFVGSSSYQCNAGVCVSPTCMDGRQNQSEVDVDCGGPNCGPCRANNDDPPNCLSNFQCDSNVCENNGCVETKAIRVRASGLAQGSSIELLVVEDGVMTRRFVTATSTEPAVYPLGNARVYNVSIWAQPNGATCSFAPSPATSGTATEAVTLELSCGRSNAELALYVRHIVRPPSFTLTQTIDGVAQMVSFNQSGAITLGTFSSSWELEITSQPTQNFGGTLVRYSCLFERDQHWQPIAPTSRISATFNPSEARHMPQIVCTLESQRPPDMGPVDMGPPDMGSSDLGMVDLGGTPCMNDGQCSSNNCYCGANSGNCTGLTGLCAAGGRAVIDTPTTNGVAPSGTFTVPSGCSEVYIEAWGAAGGNSGSENPFTFAYELGQRGGSGGYVSGTLPVTAGDVLTVWVGQGGAWNNNASSGTAGVGSFAGTAANGGASASNGDFMDFNAGGTGGGLTSVRQTGSATVTFSVPGGGGGGVGQEGQSVGAAGSGDGSGQAGGAAPDVGIGIGGGGAGDPAGAAGTDLEVGGHAGAYGTLPGTLASANGAGDGNPANASAFDRSLCMGLTGGNPAAGASAIMTPDSGDGCVVIRCVGP
ncbi:MAG: glycine rich domain-containing protein [Polyangiales bacterium]